MICVLIRISDSGYVKYAGVGYHIAALEQSNPSRVTQYYKWLLVESFYYFAVVGVPKLAILAFYLRIFTSGLCRYTVYVVAIATIATGIVCCAMCLNLCRPFALNWNPELPGVCIDKKSFYQWGSLPNIITDVVILVLPISMVLRLKTSGKMKVGLMLTFMTGSM